MKKEKSNLYGRMDKALVELHDYLWHEGWVGDEAELKRELATLTKAWDRHLQLGGRVSRIVSHRIDSLAKDEKSEALFSFLRPLHQLGLAASLLKKRDYLRAAERCQKLVDGLTINLCASIGRFDIVAEHQATKTSFEEYTSKMADALEERGAQGTGEFKRLINAVYDLSEKWNPGVSREAKALASRFAVLAAAQSVVMYAKMLKEMEALEKPLLNEIVPAATKIISEI